MIKKLPSLSKKKTCVVEELSSEFSCPTEILSAISAPQNFAIWEASESRLSSQSAEHYQRSRFAYIAVYPRKIIRLRGSGDPLNKIDFPESTEFDLEDSYAWSAFGVLGYDCSRYFDRANGLDAHPTEADLFAIYPGTLIRLERETGNIKLSSPVDGSDQQRPTVLKERHAEIRFAISRKTPTKNYTSVDIHVEAKYNFEEFCKKVKTAKEYIAAGDAFQIVFSNRFCIQANVDAACLYRHLSRKNPSAFHFLFSNSTEALVGASPERMLRVSPSPTGKLISMRLVAGTYPRDELGDMASDPKERAEHVMLVDHIRSDIGRVAKGGSVKVPDLLCKEAYRDVFHLVSEVTGALRDDKDSLDALRAVFPIATLTGTPKLRAMEIIRELEGEARGYFGGAAFVITPQGDLDSTVVIRSAACTKNNVTIRAGGGIVSDSVPEREYKETYWKAEALFDAIKESCPLNRKA